MGSSNLGRGDLGDLASPSLESRVQDRAVARLQMLERRALEWAQAQPRPTESGMGGAVRSHHLPVSSGPETVSSQRSEEPPGPDHMKGGRAPVPKGPIWERNIVESPCCPLVYPHLQTLGDTYHLGSDSPRGNTGNREITGMGPHWRGRGRRVSGESSSGRAV